MNSWAKNIVEQYTEKVKKENELKSKYLFILVEYLELMDTSHPEWREYAKDEIEQLRKLLNNLKKEELGWDA